LTLSASVAFQQSASTLKISAPVSMSLSKDPALLSAVRLTVAGVALHAGLSLEEIEDLKIIAAEACTYCIQRGVTRDGRLRVVLEPLHDRFVIEVTDPSFMSSPVTGRPPTWAEDDLADELYIIRALAEELEYGIDHESGLRLLMSKRTMPS
jgi:anti-sigma regulatory factor (Ser/Thr protein kinase)